MESLPLHKPGSVFGAILLITGCCIGAGMLGMPVMSALTGFVPSLVIFFISWLFMTTTALLLLETNLSFPGSIISMAHATLGTAGKLVAWACYIFLFYTLGVAYIAGCGELVANFGAATLGVQLPNWVGSFLISVLFGVFAYLGTRAVDLFNRLLMMGLAVSYVLLVAFGAPHVELQNLAPASWSAAPLVTPIMIIAFGFHNLIPTLTTYLHRNAQSLRRALIGGSSLVLIIYLVWEWIIIGLIPAAEQRLLMQGSDHSNMATEILSRAVGSGSIVMLAQSFAFFAIATSFLGNSLSFVDFLADGLNRHRAKDKIWLCFLVIAPPFCFALLYPAIFLTALNYAGVLGALVLFGILPALMAWSVKRTIIPGGRGLLIAIIIFSVWTIWQYFA